jgi:hypothetical protein
MTDPRNYSNPIVQAIVHLNFGETEKALDVLMGLLTDQNFKFAQGKESANGNRPAAA